MRDLPSVPAMRPPGSPRTGDLAGFIERPRGSAPRERDHRGGDHPVPSRTRQLSPPSPRVLQREAAGGQGVALAEGAFLSAPRRPAGGSPPVGLSVFRGRSLPEDLREDFLLDRSCARHVLEDLRGLPAGLLALTWTSNLTEAARPALSRRSAVSKGLRLGCPPL